MRIGLLLETKHLAAQGYIKVEGIDFDDTIAHVTRLESRHVIISIACTLNLKLYQMDVKMCF